MKIDLLTSQLDKVSELSGFSRDTLTDLFVRKKGISKLNKQDMENIYVAVSTVVGKSYQKYQTKDSLKTHIQNVSIPDFVSQSASSMNDYRFISNNNNNSSSSSSSGSSHNYNYNFSINGNSSSSSSSSSSSHNNNNNNNNGPYAANFGFAMSRYSNNSNGSTEEILELSPNSDVRVIASHAHEWKGIRFGLEQPDTVKQTAPMITCYYDSNRSVVGEDILKWHIAKDSPLSKSIDPIYRGIHILVGLPLYFISGAAQIRAEFTIPSAFHENIKAGKFKVIARMYSETSHACLQMLTMHVMFLNSRKIDLSSVGRKIHVSKKLEGNVKGIIPKPVDLTSLIQLESTNVINFLPFGDPEHFIQTMEPYFIVEIVDIMTISKLIEKVYDRDKLQGIDLAKSFLKEEDNNELGSASSLKLSLLCPLSLSVLNNPVRGANCKHAQCFELETYITLALTQRTWFCPVCSLETPFSHLRVDAQIKEILEKRTQQNLEATKIMIDTSGNYRFHVEEPRYKRPAEDDDEPSANPKRLNQENSLNNQGASTNGNSNSNNSNSSKSNNSNLVDVDNLNDSLIVLD